MCGILFIPLQRNSDNMSEHKIKVVLLDETLTFVRSLPIKVQEKIVYNYRKSDFMVRSNNK